MENKNLMLNLSVDEYIEIKVGKEVINLSWNKKRSNRSLMFHASDNVSITRIPINVSNGSCAVCGRQGYYEEMCGYCRIEMERQSEKD